MAAGIRALPAARRRSRRDAPARPLAPRCSSSRSAASLPGPADPRASAPTSVRSVDPLRRMWNLPAGPGFVVWDDDMASRLQGFQQLEGSRADLIVVQPRHLARARRGGVPRAAYRFDPLAQLPPQAAVATAGRGGRRAAEARRQEAITAAINASSPLPVCVLHPEILRCAGSRSLRRTRRS